MPSDRTRFTYDERRQYRAVVEQQGRAIMDADWNEGFRIVAEEQRKEALDFVGPVGTPDNGYEVGFTPAGGLNFDLSIRPGTMYVGGMRVELPARPDGDPILYSTQPDWLDPTLPDDPGNELVLLTLLEQEISAVEDSSLKDVALGGVDTAQRLRLVQRVVRRATNAAACEAAMAQAVAEWAALGLDFDSSTMQLTSPARLQVSFADDGQPPDLCEPTAQGGYLEAANQLICVQLSAADAFTWGYDNASFLYRITVDPGDATLVHLQSRPVDEFHEPRVGQVVEVLRPAFALSNGEWVAEPRGEFMTLAAAYNPDGQSLTLPAAVSMDYQASDGTIQTHPYLFLRVWEETVTFTPGTAHALGSTGLLVTLSAAGNLFTPGAAWAFAVRPSTPVEVYPPRYLDAPQPPEGPRAWVCPLAVISWAGAVGNIGQILEDCREHFDNLVELTKRKSGGCGCCVTFGPDDVDGGAGLQAAIDKLVADAQGGPVTVSLRPGVYQLPQPLRFGPEHRRLTLEGCDRNVVLQPAEEAGDFIDGLIALADTNQVTLRRLILRAARTVFTDHTDVLAGMEFDLMIQLVKAMAEDSDAFTDYLKQLTVSIGVRAAQVAALRVEECSFPFRRTADLPFLQVGILLSGVCPNFSALNNHFGPIEIKEGEGEEEEVFETPPVIFGILHTPTIVAKIDTGGEVGQIEGGVLLPELDRAIIAGNVFQGIGAAVLVQSDVGNLRVEDNRVRHSYAGLLWLGLDAFVPFVSQQQTPWFFWGEQVVRDPLVALGLFLGRAYPLPKHFAAPPLHIEGAGFSLFLPIPQPIGLPGTLMAVVLRAFLMLELPVLKQLVATVRYDLILAENSVEALRRVKNDRAPQGLTASHVYLLWNGERNPGSMLISANRGIAHTHDDGIPAALVLFAGVCAITGGHLRNRDEEQAGPTLVAFSLTQRDDDKDPPIAVTGNVFHGQRPQLPQRFAVPAPMDDWVSFNAWFFS